jgi:hypothetical protein
VKVASGVAVYGTVKVWVGVFVRAAVTDTLGLALKDMVRVGLGVKGVGLNTYDVCVGVAVELLVDVKVVVFVCVMVRVGVEDEVKVADIVTLYVGVAVLVAVFVWVCVGVFDKVKVAVRVYV